MRARREIDPDPHVSTLQGRARTILAVALFTPELHEPLRDVAWSPEQARAAIRAIVADADDRYDESGLWAPVDAWDDWGGELNLPPTVLSTGASGAAWGLDVLRRRGHAEPRTDPARVAVASVEAGAGRPTRTSGSSRRCRRTRASSWARPARCSWRASWERTSTRIRCTSASSRTRPVRRTALLRLARDDGRGARDARGDRRGTVGDVVARCGRRAARPPRGRRFLDVPAIRQVAGRLARPRLEHQDPARGGRAARRRTLPRRCRRRAPRPSARRPWSPTGWRTGRSQRRRARRLRRRDPHAVGATAPPASPRRRAASSRRSCCWPPASSCGAPARRGMEKGTGICHGTAGSGFALLKVHARTQDELWLDRARRFGMHVAGQVDRWRERRGAGRTTLWTGDVGAALFLQAVSTSTRGCRSSTTSSDRRRRARAARPVARPRRGARARA